MSHRIQRSLLPGPTFEAESTLSEEHLKAVDGDRPRTACRCKERRGTVAVDQINDIRIPSDLIGVQVELVERVGLSGRPLQSNRRAVDEQIRSHRPLNRARAELLR